jgi:hypothetical protein
MRAVRAVEDFSGVERSRRDDARSYVARRHAQSHVAGVQQVRCQGGRGEVTAMARKVFILTEEDFANLLMAVDRNPNHGERGGSSQVLSQAEEDAHDKAHRFYNYQVRTWVSRMKDG